MTNSKQQPRSIVSFIGGAIAVALFMIIAVQGWSWLKNQRDKPVDVSRNEIVSINEATKTLPSMDQIKASEDALEKCHQDWSAGKVPHRTNVPSDKRASMRKNGVEYLLDCPVGASPAPSENSN